MPQSDPMPPGAEAQVLVVEDNATNRMAIRALLDRFGVEADYVATGLQAVSASQNKSYRLVLMDLMLPGMDGYTATRQIRQLEYGTGRHTPVVAVTAVDPSVSRNACLAVGMDGFLSKPIEPDALEDVLRRWSGRGGPARPLAETDAAHLIESFLEVTTQLLHDLSKAIETHDFSAAAHLVHEVKASSLVVSAREMAQLARRLEQAIDAQRWREVLDDYRDLVAAFRRTTEELRVPVQQILKKRIGTLVHRPGP